MASQTQQSLVPVHTQQEDATIWGPVASVIVIALANVIAYAANENSWMFKHFLRRLRMPPLLFISNRADCVDNHVRPKTYWAFDLIDPAHLVYSNCLNTYLLLALHIFTVLYWVVTVIVDVAIEYYRVWCYDPSCSRRHGAYGEWASYLTNWSISLLGIAGAIALANTARYLHRVRQHQQQYQQQHQQQYQHEQQPGLTPAALEIGDDGNIRDGRLLHTSQLPPHNSDQYGPRDRGVGTGSQRPSKQQQPAGPTLAGNANGPAVNGAVQMTHLPRQPGVSSAAAETALAPGCCLSPKSKKAVVGASVGTLHHDAAATVVMVGDASNCNGSEGYDRRDELKHKWDWLSCAHCLVMETATTAAFFVSFWYWVGIVGIAKSGFDINGGTLMAHAGNVVVAFLQVVLTRLPIVSYHFQVLLWYSTAYMIFLWIFGGVTDIWRYSLNWQRSGPAVAFIIMPVVTFIMFLLWYFAAVIREHMLFAGGRCSAKRRVKRRQQQQNRGSPGGVVMHTAAPQPNSREDTV